jgi:hypothetical protein
LAALLAGTSAAYSGVIGPDDLNLVRPSADFLGVRRHDASQVYVRSSTAAELSVGAGEPSVAIPERGYIDYTWRTSDGDLWHTIPQVIPYLRPPVLEPLHADQPLSIVVPFIDYRRALNFAIDFRQVGNEFQIDAFRVISWMQTKESRGPEDQRKEYINLLGELPAGNYTVAARFFDLTLEKIPAGNDEVGFGLFDRQRPGSLWNVDFADFRANPLGFQLPAGASLQITAQRAAFRVVPEPSSLALALCLASAPLIQRRKRPSHLC